MSTGPCGQECHSHDHSKCNHTNDDKESEAQIIGDSLLAYVDLPRVRCLNVADADSVEGIFKTYDRRRDTTEFIESDADDELLLYVPFTEVVKIKGLTIVGGTDASDASAPSKATLFINRDDLDFDSAGDAQSVQEIDLLDGALSDTEYPLKTSKFTAVRDLTILLQGNFGGQDVTQVNCVHFRGSSNNISTNRVVMHAVYESQGQLKDHKVNGDMNGVQSQSAA